MSRPKLRKVDSARRKQQRKEVKRALQRRTSMFLDIPEKCCVCQTPFDKKNKEMAQTWHVVVFEERQVARLTCPSCWEKVETTMEEQTNAS